MKRLTVQLRTLLTQLAVVLLALCFVGQSALGAKKHPKVFILQSKSISSYNQALDGFKQQSLPEWNTFEYDMRGTLRNSSNMIKRLKQEDPDLVVAIGAKALAALTKSKVKYPTVFCMAMKPASYDLQGLNITGISLTTSPEKQLKVLTTFSSKIKTIGVLLWKKNSDDLLKPVEALAKKYNVRIVPIELESEKEIPRKLRRVINSIDAIWMLDDAYIHSKESLEFVIQISLKHNLPFMAISEVFVREGALVSLSPSFFDNGKQAAKLARRILQQHVSPKNIPISYHNNPNLIINLKIARKIGLTVPLELMDEAKKIYK